MSEMVERVARALYLRGAPDGDWSKEGPHACNYYRAVARAAIAAMREPTAEMLDALDIPFFTNTGSRTEGVIVGWPMMIDAALKEEAA